MADDDGWAPRMLTREQGREEQRRFWASKTIPERLAAMTELNERLRRMRGIEIDEEQVYSNPHFVRRSRS